MNNFIEISNDRTINVKHIVLLLKNRVILSNLPDGITINDKEYAVIKDYINNMDIAALQNKINNQPVYLHSPHCSCI